MSDDAKQLIADYEAGASRASQVLRGMSPAQVNRAPGGDAPKEVGRWSAAQVVIHLQDAEIAFADRVRRVVAMDVPTLLAWDENRYADRLHYDAQSAEDAAAIIELTRRQLSRVLKKLTDAELHRVGQHSSAGPQSVLDILSKANWHLEHHLRFVEAKRRYFGKT